MTKQNKGKSKTRKSSVIIGDGGSAFHSAMLQEIGRRVFLAEMPDGKIKYWPTKRRKTST